MSVLIGLCDFATFFLCCLPSIGLVERRGEGDIGDAIALDRVAYVAFAASLNTTDLRKAAQEKGREATQTDEDAYEAASGVGEDAVK